MAFSGSGRGSSLAPLLIRLGLGVTFIYAGLGKVMGTFEIPPESAAQLAAMGVAIEKSPAAPGAPVPNAPSPPVAAPSAAPPSGDPMPADQYKPSGSEGPPVVRVDDYAPKTPVRPMYMLALALRNAADPPAKADGSPSMRLWPAGLGHGPWPVRFAYIVTGTELIGGALVLIGMFTRVWSFGLAGVMVGAIWLTQVGPAMQSGATVLGFLPDHAAWDGEKWMTLLWQFGLLTMSLALVVGGGGRLSIDGILFGGSPSDDGHAGA